jgi:hypothetical protein
MTRVRWTLTIVCLALGQAAVAGEPQVNGRLEQFGSFELLRVWGTPQQMGFAHGYLAGDGYIEYLEYEVAAAERHGPGGYGAIVAAMAPLVELPDSMLDELRGFLEGLAAREAGLPEIKGLGRVPTIDDLVFLNAGDLVRAFGCSGFTVWGDRAGEAGVVTARNFDFGVSDPRLVGDGFILVRRPEGRHQVASVSVPGYLGAFTGINDQGVCAFMHDGTGGQERMPKGRYTPAAITLALLLERAGPADAHVEAEAALRRIVPYPFSYMIRVVAPVDTGAPEHVFRIDAEGLSENPSGADFCITTNHYLRSPTEPLDRAHPWSLTRFGRLEERLTGTVTPEAAWKALGAVAASESATSGTLHSVVVYPRLRKLDIAFAGATDGTIKPATAFYPTTLRFSRLFGGQE